MFAFRKTWRWRWRADRILSSRIHVASWQDAYVAPHSSTVSSHSKSLFTWSQHTTLRGKEMSSPVQGRRQKWRPHTKHLTVITLHSPLLLLCLLIALCVNRVARDGGPLTATTPATSAVLPISTDLSVAAVLFFDIRMTEWRFLFKAKWLWFPDSHSRLNVRWLSLCCPLSRTRVLAAKWSCEWTPKVRSVLHLTMWSRCQYAGSFRTLNCCSANFGWIELALDMPSYCSLL